VNHTELSAATTRSLGAEKPPGRDVLDAAVGRHSLQPGDRRSHRRSRVEQPGGDEVEPAVLGDENPTVDHGHGAVGAAAGTGEHGHRAARRIDPVDESPVDTDHCQHAIGKDRGPFGEAEIGCHHLGGDHLI
jgi:hypothetical protein